MACVGLARALIDVHAEDAIIIHVIKARVTGTGEAPDRVITCRLVGAIVSIERTLIDIIADRPVSRISTVAVTPKEARGVGTGRVLVTVVVADLTLVNINAVDPISSISVVAYTVEEGVP